MSRRQSGRLVVLGVLIVLAGVALVAVQWFRRPPVSHPATRPSDRPSPPGQPPAATKPPGLEQSFPPSVSDKAVRAKRVGELMAKARAADSPAAGGEALRALHAVLRLEPQHAEAAALRAKVLAYYPTDRARDWLKRALALPQEPGDITLARVQALLGDGADAIVTVTVPKGQYQHPGSFRIVGEALTERGDFLPARDAFRKSIAAAWQAAKDRAARGPSQGLRPDLAALGNEQQRARECCEAAVGLARAGDLDGAWGEILLNGSSASSEVLHQTTAAVVDAAVDLGDYAVAWRDANMVAFSTAGTRVLHHRTADHLAAQGDYERARQVIALMYKDDYHTDAARYDFVRRLAARDPATAEREAAAIVFRVWRTRAYVALADLHLRQQNPAEARRLAGLARASLPTEDYVDESNAHLAGLEARMGDTPAALKIAGAIASPFRRQFAFRRVAAACIERRDLPAATQALHRAFDAVAAMNQNEFVAAGSDDFYRHRDAASRRIIALQLQAQDRAGAAKTAARFGGTGLLAAALTRAGDLPAASRLADEVKADADRRHVCLSIAEALIPEEVVPAAVGSEEGEDVR